MVAADSPVMRALLMALLCVAARGATVCPSSVKTAARQFKLTASEYDLKLPDGRSVPQMAYNGSAVGPTLQLTLGEDVSVDITNNMRTGTSTHWHGLYLRNSAWTDGVDGVSQEPYRPGTTFRYRFKAEPAGTFWYHAHTGVQFANGLRGPLIIRDPKDPYAKAYDEERVLMLYDQASATADEELANLESGEAAMQMGLCDGVAPPRDYSDLPYYSLYTNGQGLVKDRKTGKALGKPHVITVKQGKTYRFRTIQGAASWGIMVEPTGHPIDIIAVDGADTQATRTRAYLFTPGERVDFLLKADRPVANYWINIATINGFNSPAVLHYQGAPAPDADPKLGAPRLDLGCKEQLRPGLLDLSLQTLRPHPSLQQLPTQTESADARKAKVTKVVYLTDNAVPELSREMVLGKRPILGMPSTVQSSSGCPKLANGQTSKYCWSLNWVPFQSPKQPLLTTPVSTELSTSTNVLDIPLGSVVDVAFVNPTAMVHPMHIHGYSFYVLGTGRGNILKADGTIDYTKLERGPYMVRDTVPVPNAAPGGDPMGPPGSGMAMGGSSGNMAAMGNRRLLQQMDGMGGMDGMATPAPMPMDGMATPAPKPMDGMAKPAPKPMDGMAKPAPKPMDGMAKPAPKPTGMAAMPGMAAPAPKPTVVPMDAAMATMSMPVNPDTYGYTVVRFVADNPGPWAWHCHIDPHVASGMMMALRVGAKWNVPAGIDACAATARSSSSSSSSMSMNMDG